MWGQFCEKYAPNSEGEFELNEKQGEIVHCSECEYFERTPTGELVCYKHSDPFTEHWVIVSEGDFCSMGEIRFSPK